MRRATAVERSILNVAASQIGTTERPNGATKYGRFYGKTLGYGTYFIRAPWCAMFTVWCAYESALQRFIPRSASTIEQAKWFQARDRWGTEPRPGALAFFDWQMAGPGAPVGVIDHVGFVEGIHSDRRIVTLEGNTSNQVARRFRSRNLIVGYGYPNYPTELPQPKSETASNRKRATR